jgi:hypothetical protein
MFWSPINVIVLVGITHSLPEELSTENVVYNLDK